MTRRVTKGIHLDTHNENHAARPVKLAIFDFDGTLADTLPFFLSVFNEVALRFRFRPINPDEVPALRRLSARELISHVGISSWKFPFVVRAMLAKMKAQRHTIGLFPGVDEVLRALAESGTRIAIVSSNSRENIVHVLGPENAALISHYECGASMFRKAARLRRVLRRAGVAASEAMYIGDQCTDYDAASAVGIPFGAVVWGYADIVSLRRHQPAHVFGAVSDMAGLAWNNCWPAALK